MNFWDVLNLAPTSDEQAIKKAYRIQLRQHHPEEDPEGFKRVREAYEAAVRHASSGKQSPVASQAAKPQKVTSPISQTESPQPTPSRTEQTQTEQTIYSYPAIQELYLLLNDPFQRFNQYAWQHWLQQVQQMLITEQEQISEGALQLVLANRWLPGDVIDWLWNGLGWEMLLKGSQTHLELGEFLNSWRQQQCWVPLVELATMTHAEQRATLGFIRPFQDAFNASQLNAIDYLFMQPMPGSYIRSPRVTLYILRAFLNCPAITGSLAYDYLIRLMSEQQSHPLSVGQLQLLAEVGIKLNQPEIVHQLCAQLQAQQAYVEVAELQYELAIQQEQIELALGYAYLRQQWAPLPIIYWRAERRLCKKQPDSPIQKSTDWLYGQLINQGHSQFNHPLDFRDQRGLYGHLIKCFWAGKYGSWAWITELYTQLQTEDKTHRSGWQQLCQLTAYWLNQKRQTREGSTSLLHKLDHYGQDNFFTQPPLTPEELASLTPESWRACLCRHPLLPDNWFKQLVEANYISQEILETSPLYPDYVDTLCFYRYNNPTFQITSPWANLPFTGTFDWAILYYGQLTSPELNNNSGVLQALPPLPDMLSESALGKLVPFLEAPGSYLSDATQSLRHYPEQFVFRYVTNAQVRLLMNHTINDLVELARSRELPAYAALAELFMPEHFEEAVVCWNLLVTAAKRQPQYSAIIHWLQEKLQRLRTEKKLDKEFYEYAKPEIIHWMLFLGNERIENFEDLAVIRPAEEAAAFHFPVFYILAQLKQGMSPKGYNIEPLTALSQQREKQTQRQQQVTDLALSELENLYQQHLDEEIARKKVKSFQKVRLKCHFLGMIFLWMLCMTTASVGHGLSFSHNSGILSFFLLYQLFIIRQVCRALPRRKHQLFYLLSALITFLYVSWFELKLFAGLNLLIHFFFIYKHCPLCVNGRWGKQIVKQRKVDLRALLDLK